MSTEQVRMEPVGGATPDTTTENNLVGATAATTEAIAPAAPVAKAADTVLADELREFGKQIEAMFHTARTSTRGKEIESQLTAAWRDVEKGVNTAITKAQSSDFKGTVQGTAQYAADEIQTGLARGLKTLNQWMSEKRNEMEERRKAREAAESAAAMKGTMENDVADRYSGDAPVFGQGVQAPNPPVEINPDPPAMTGDNPIADRFNG